MNIGNIFKAGKNFVTRNLETGDDFGNVKEGRDEAARVDSEVGRIHQDTVDVGSELNKLEENSKLTPPTFEDVSNKQVLFATTSAGAVIGGAIGVVSNLTTGGAGSVDLNPTEVPIYEQKLDGLGFDTRNYEVGSETVLEGWDVDITPRPLAREQVGTLTERNPEVNGSSSILASGLTGVAIGAGAGALAGAGVIGLRKALGKDYNGKPGRETEGDNKLLIAGGVAGAAIGAGAGALSSVLNSTTVPYETQSIQMETKVLGQIPNGDGFYVPNRDGLQPPMNTEQVAEWMDGNIDRLADKGFRGTENLRPEDVKGQVPARTLFGNLDIKTEEKEISVGPSLVSSVLGGAAVGAVTGVAGGVLVNVLRKTL